MKKKFKIYKTQKQRKNIEDKTHLTCLEEN